MILFNDIASQWNEIRFDMDPFLSKGQFIGGRDLEVFEKEFANYCGARYAIGVSSGTDALKLAIQTLRTNIWSRPHADQLETVIPANCHLSSALASAYFNFKTTILDCDENHNLDLTALKEYMKVCSNPKDTVIIPTHMYGLPVHIPSIKEIAPESLIIEDCSHAHGATIDGQHVGVLGDLGVFSLYPTKNLGAFGDAGIIITNDFEHDIRLRALRNYGSYGRDDCQNIGWNSRLDTLQALFLRKKLPLLRKWNSKRYGIAKLYNELLSDTGDLILPKLTEGRVFHIYQIRTTRRDFLQRFLITKNIPTLIHYPVPLHKTEQFHTSEDFPRAETYAQEILSLPIHPYLKMEDIRTICDTIKDFFNPCCLECGGHQELMEDHGRYLCRWCTRKIIGERTDIINPTGRYRQI
jgi:dTDP-4-amino-4,6-dideoxygalactose transaminase